MSLPGFEESIIEHNGIKHMVYMRGEGRGVVLMHELPGLTPECVRLANTIAKDYRVYMPLLFGEPNERKTGKNLVRVCISREFKCLARNKTSPIVEWLKAVCRKAHSECGGNGVGAIGMCLTGNFAISLMVEPTVMAPVTCQPSLPLTFCIPNKSLAMNKSELLDAKARASDGLELMGFRFSNDCFSPSKKFRRISEEFGTAFIGKEIDSSRDNPHKISSDAHAVLTGEFNDKTGHPTKVALESVLAFFKAKL